MDFYFEGADDQGNQTSGEIKADNIQDARHLLTNQGYIPERIRPVEHARKRALSNAELPLFFNQIHQLLKAGMSFYQALSHCAQFATNKRIELVARNICQQLERGFNVTTAIEQSIKNLPYHIPSQLSIAEKSGSLIDCTERIYQYFNIRNQRLRRIQKSLTQPLITLVVAISVGFFMIVNLLPAIADIYQDPTTLPPITQWFLSLGNRLTHISGHWGLIISRLMILIIAIRLIVKRELYFLLPPFRSLAYTVHLQKNLYHLSILLRSGLGIRQALDILISNCPSNRISLCLIRANEEVQQGIPLSKALSHCKINKEYQSLIKTSEESGTLAEMLGYCAAQMDERLFNGFDRMIQLIHPLATLLVGLFIATLIAAMYLPLFDLSNSL